MRSFLYAAQCMGRQTHGHLALRTVAGCNTPAFAHVPQPQPMCRDSFASAAAAPASESARAAEGEAGMHARHVEAYLLQCAAHANEEYLVRTHRVGPAGFGAAC